MVFEDRATRVGIRQRATALLDHAGLWSGWVQENDLARLMQGGWSGGIIDSSEGFFWLRGGGPCLRGTLICHDSNAEVQADDFNKSIAF